MGWSAGGHLALLYAYSTAGNYDDSTKNPVKLVISEAGPTDFTNFEGIATNNQDIRNGFMLSLAQLSALTGAEYTIDNYENNTEYPGVWEDASPIYYVSTNQGNNFPYTILAYGSNVNTPQGNNPFISGDGTVAYSQATSLAAQLVANKYMLYPLPDIAHLQFGAPNVEGETMQNTVNPLNSTKKVSDYYKLLKEELEDL